MQDLNSPEGHGWEKEEGILKPVLMTKEPAPKSLLELTSCQYKKSECRTNFSCNNAGLSCTESCVCMADERFILFYLFINFARGEKKQNEKPLTGENSQNDMFQ